MYNLVSLEAWLKAGKRLWLPVRTGRKLFRPFAKKRCSICQKLKKHIEFYRDRSRNDGLRDMCKKCANWNKNSVLQQRRKRNKRKRAYKANYKLNNAIALGKIEKPARCQKCGLRFHSRKIHGHHTDYSNPLEVIWLCVSCHLKAHHEK